MCLAAFIIPELCANVGAVTKLIVRHYTSIIDKVIWLETIFFKISSIKNVILSVHKCRIYCDT
jgi:hypothetical protein